MNDPAVIDGILQNAKTIAVVGFSTRPSRAGYYVPAYLQARGYRIIPVNPNLAEALSEPAYPDLLAVPQAIDVVLIFRRSEFVPAVVEQAIAIGAGAVWMQLGIRNEQAAEMASSAGLEVVMDTCMMIEHKKWSRNRT